MGTRSTILSAVYLLLPPLLPLDPSAAISTTRRSGSFTAFSSSGNASTLFGMAMAWTNSRDCIWGMNASLIKA